MISGGGMSVRSSVGVGRGVFFGLVAIEQVDKLV